MKTTRTASARARETDPLQPRKLRLGGKLYLLRPLKPEDLSRLQAFFYSHTEETVRLRYGYAVKGMTDERAHDLVSVDQSRDFALAIFESRAGEEIIHAVGRYCLDADGRSAEVAFVVRESKRRIGMATTLFSALEGEARRRGLEFIWGRVRRDNAPMLALLRRAGGRNVPSPGGEDGEVDVRVDLHRGSGTTGAG